MQEEAVLVRFRWSGYNRGMPRIAVIILLCLLAVPISAEDWQLHAVFGNQVVLSVDGERALVGEGETGPGGVRVLRISGSGAVVERAGERRELQVERRPRGAGAPQVDRRGAGVSVHRDSAGEHAVTGGVNGQAVTFVIDPEAEWVLLRERDARRAGLDPDRGESVRVERARGRIEGRSLRVDRLQLGHLARDDVPVIVLADEDLPRSRLGQAFLDAFEVEFDGGAYTIRP